MEISLAGLDNLKPSSSKPSEEAAVLAMMEGVKKKGAFRVRSCGNTVLVL